VTTSRQRPEIERRLRRRARSWLTNQELAGYVERELAWADSLNITTATDLDGLLDPNQPDELLRHACGLAGQVGDRRSTVPRLARVLSAARSDIAMCESAKALSQLGGRNMFRCTAPLALGHSSREVREWATYALSFGHDFDYGDAADLLLSIFVNRDEDDLVRAQAAEGIAYHATRRRRRQIVPALIDGLSDGSAEIRFWSCFALSDLGNASDIPALESLLGDRTVSEWMGWSVGREARFAIECIRHYLRQGPAAEYPESGELE
jgi:HEAT repeat protein